MSLKNIKESELKDLLDEVASDLAKAFESEKDKLVKAEESSSSSMEKSSVSAGSASSMEKTAVPASEGSAGPSSKFDDRQTQDKSKLSGGVKPNPMTEKGAPLGKDDAPPEKSPEASASGSPAPEGSASSAPGGDAEAPADPAAAGPEAGAPGADAGAPADPAMDQAPLSPEALQAEYAKLPPEELDMHIQAALAAKAALAGPAGPGADGMAPMGPDAGAPVPPAPAPSPAPMAMNEDFHNSPERDAPHGKGAPGMELARKHEQEISELKALVKSQQEEFNQVATALKNFVEAPQRKAVTSVAHLAKTEAPPKVITKESINSRLLELSKRPDLKKSDRQLINDFYDGKVKADALAPLFEGYIAQA